MRRVVAGFSPLGSPKSSFLAAAVPACDVPLPLRPPKESSKHSPKDSVHRWWTRKRRRMFYVRLQNSVRGLCLPTLSSTKAFAIANNNPHAWSSVNRRVRKIHPRAQEIFLGIFVAMCLVVARGFLEPRSRPTNDASRRAEAASHEFEILVSWSRPTKLRPSGVFRPPSLDSSPKQRARRRNYGGLEIALLEEAGAARRIRRDRTLDEGKYDRTRSTDDTNDNYYNLDDDDLRNTYRGWDDDQQLYLTKRCRRTSWHRHLPLNCNTFHEYDLPNVAYRGGLKHVGAGAYKHVFLAETPTETVVYKNFGASPKFDLKNYERMRKDAMATERVSPHPLIVDIYGYCGLAQFDEAMPHGGLQDVALPGGGRRKVQLNDSRQLVPRNKLRPSQKLQLALEMFEAIALLHNYPGGVIVHDDIQLLQFLLTSDGHIKLNDFNRMEPMLWNDKDKEYCRYRNGPGQGDWRSPEEYQDQPLNEKIDIYSLGNNLYSILTGLSPFYQLKLSTKDIQAKVIAGDRPYIDPRWRNRSFAEGKIAELIVLCQKHNADDRIDSGAAVKFLRAAVEENNRHHLQEDQTVGSD